MCENKKTAKRKSSKRTKITKPNKLEKWIDLV